jgi:hypothetical protein
MKKIFILLFTLSCSIITKAQQTYIPDMSFENYLENNGMGDGVMFNNYVPTAAIDTLTYLDLSNAFCLSLDGIEDFVALNT